MFTFSAGVVVLLVALALWGRRVSYEQSINSFFAEDDPAMRVYQKAARTFGDDNFVFVVYDDTALVTPGGLDRVSELAAAVAPDRIPGVQHVESLDAMPLLWAIDDTLLALNRLPSFARDRGLEGGQGSRQGCRPEDQRDDRQRSGQGRGYQPGDIGRTQGTLDKTSSFSRHTD